MKRKHLIVFVFLYLLSAAKQQGNATTSHDRNSDELSMIFINLNTLKICDSNGFIAFKGENFGLIMNYSDTSESLSAHRNSNPKEKLILHLSIPAINHFIIEPKGENQKVSIGFNGISLGFDFYYSKNKFVNTTLSNPMNGWAPLPLYLFFSEREGVKESIASINLSLSNNHRFKRVSAGYGLVISRNYWILSNEGFNAEIPRITPVSKNHLSTGFIFPVYFQLGKYFHLGIVYVPTFYRPALENPYKYEHVVSLDFAWKIGVR